VQGDNGRIQVRVPANYGEIWIPAELCEGSVDLIETVEIVKTPEPVSVPEVFQEPTAKEMREEKKTKQAVVVPNKPYEEMSVEELQEGILEKMRKNGPVTDYMLGTVRENTHHGSLVNWIKSFQ